ncbi:class I SAM-dependent methyltransferase [Streptomyces sp. NPDC058534]|uniref:class I SAM-dependent methyltransferase n=1 Tax=Streptomyces sp. NPDC058534 TaxID=3346541 RepID=UPI003655B071
MNGPVRPPAVRPPGNWPTAAPGRLAEPPFPLAGPAPWAASDPYAAALRAGRGPLFLRRSDGWLLPLEVERWCAGADTVDLEVLDRCEGAVLDVGCGPGRLVAELAARGSTVLGIDVSEAAVAHTVRSGGQSLRRSVFEPLPGEGRWDTVLLMDGNVGIGGDPRALLARVAALLAPGGLLIAETARVDGGGGGPAGAPRGAAPAPPGRAPHPARGGGPAPPPRAPPGRRRSRRRPGVREPRRPRLQRPQRHRRPRVRQPLPLGADRHPRPAPPRGRRRLADRRSVDVGGAPLRRAAQRPQ